MNATRHEVEAASAEIARLQRQVERERAARQEAERIAETGLRDLYERGMRDLAGTQQQIRLLEAIATASNQITAVDDVLAFALAEICRFLGWPVGRALHCGQGQGQGQRHGQDARGPALRGAGIWHVADGWGLRDLRPLLEAGGPGGAPSLSEQAQAGALPVWIADAEIYADARAGAGAAAGADARPPRLRAGLGVPVLVGQEVAAVLEFHGTEAQEPDAAVMRLMSQIGVQLGRVIERDRARGRLIYDASHDPLTGLPNRGLFLDCLRDAVDRHQRDPGLHFAVMFIDLDGFKIVNDSLGHSAGDALLVQVAARFRHVLRRDDRHARNRRRADGARDTLARLGGDEFTALIFGAGSPADALRVSARLQDALRRPFEVAGQLVHTSASIGIASSLGHTPSPDTILRDADLAMYRAKSLGRARSEFYDATMHATAMRRLSLEGDLRHALEHNQLVLHYQPILSLEGPAAAGPTVVGLEALVRWKRPDGTLVPPGQFIPLAEETGLIIPLGLWVLRQAFRDTLRWQSFGRAARTLSVSVNISVRQFVQPDLIARVREIIEDTGIDPATVRLEITESATAADAEQAVQVLSRLKSLGVQLSLDDFGTGFSSLSYLERFPLDVLKIDRSFVARMSDSERSARIVRAIVGLARSLGLAAVAEGIETGDQLAQLQELGCDLGQGFLLGRPLDRAGMDALLAASGPSAPAPA